MENASDGGNIIESVVIGSGGEGDQPSDDDMEVEDNGGWMSTHKGADEIKNAQGIALANWTGETSIQEVLEGADDLLRKVQKIHQMIAPILCNVDQSFVLIEAVDGRLDGNPSRGRAIEICDDALAGQWEWTVSETIIALNHSSSAPPTPILELLRKSTCPTEYTVEYFDPSAGSKKSFVEQDVYTSHENNLGHPAVCALVLAATQMPPKPTADAIRIMTSRILGQTAQVNPRKTNYAGEPTERRRLSVVRDGDGIPYGAASHMDNYIVLDEYCVITLRDEHGMVIAIESK